MGTSQLERHVVDMNGLATSLVKGVYGRVHSCYYEYASGGAGTIGVLIRDQFMADLLNGQGAGITAGNSAMLTRDDIGGTIAVGDLTFSVTGLPSEPYTVVLYVIP